MKNSLQQNNRLRCLKLLDHYIRLGRERHSAGRPENSGVYGYERVILGIAPTNFSVAFIMRHIIEAFDSWRLDVPELFYLTKQTSLKIRQR
jgi:hypothetical protein